MQNKEFLKMKPAGTLCPICGNPHWFRENSTNKKALEEYTRENPLKLECPLVNTHEGNSIKIYFYNGELVICNVNFTSKYFNDEEKSCHNHEQVHHLVGWSNYETSFYNEKIIIFECKEYIIKNNDCDCKHCKNQVECILAECDFFGEIFIGFIFYKDDVLKDI